MGCLDANKIIAGFMGRNITHSDPDTNMDTVAKKGDKFAFECKYIPRSYKYCADLTFTEDWNLIMGVGDKMHDLIMDGNWGLFEQFFSDEMHGYDRFKEACGERNKEKAIKWILFFVEALEHQDPETVKKAKQYNGN